MGYDLVIKKLLDSNNYGMSRLMIKSYYYRWVLSATDKVVFQTILSCVGYNTKDNTYINSGLLVANAKRRTLAEKAGLHINTVDKSLTRLHNLGVIIKVRTKYKNNQYVAGFRTRNKDNLFLIYHLISEYDDAILIDVENQLADIRRENRKGSPSISTTSYRISAGPKEYIVKNVFNFRFFQEKLENYDQTILEILFDRNDCYDGRQRVRV